MKFWRASSRSAARRGTRRSPVCVGLLLGRLRAAATAKKAAPDGIGAGAAAAAAGARAAGHAGRVWLGALLRPNAACAVVIIMPPCYYCWPAPLPQQQQVSTQHSGSCCPTQTGVTAWLRGSRYASHRRPPTSPAAWGSVAPCLSAWQLPGTQRWGRRSAS
jgi:hypothetical protein